MAGPTQCFVSYSHNDSALLKDFLPLLQGLANIYNFKIWHDRKIAGGHDWNPTIKQAMDDSDFFLCLVTDRFFGSTYIFEHELPTARKARADRKALVVPLVFEGSCWRAYFGAYVQAIPTNQQGQLTPIKQWKPRGDGYTAGIEGVEKAIVDWFGATPHCDFAGVKSGVMP